MTLSVVIPAFNEEACLSATLAAIGFAARGRSCEVLVVDNESTDRTGAIALEHGVTVITESVHNIARVRNAGAQTSAGDVLIFIDADMLVRPTLLHAIVQAMREAECLGGAVAVEYMAFRRRWKTCTSTGGCRDTPAAAARRSHSWNRRQR